MEQEKEREGAHLRKVFNLLHPYIRTHILHNIPYTFPKMLTRRICLTIKSFSGYWSCPLFSWPSSLIQGWKIRCKSLLGVKGWTEEGHFINKFSQCDCFGNPHSAHKQHNLHYAQTPGASYLHKVYSKPWFYTCIVLQDFTSRGLI